MSSSIAGRYIELLDGDQQARLALLVCSASLQLDDDTACGVVELASISNGSTGALIRRVKNLGCVWKEWNGFWYVTEDVRRDLLAHLYQELSDATVIRLRSYLAEKADKRVARLLLDQKLDTSDKLLSKFEASYQRILIPERSLEGAQELAELWRHAPPPAGTAIAQSVDYLADELDQYLSYLPAEILFLRGIAARSRDDKSAQEQYFAEVWMRGRNGLPGYIHALASHYFALLIERRDPEKAENALRDSIDWTDLAQDRGLVYYSLGQLLARNRFRFKDAEQAYLESLTLVRDSQERAKVYYSLGDLWRNAPVPVLNADAPSLGRLDIKAEGITRLLERWGTGEEKALDKLIPLVYDELHRIAVSYLRRERREHTLQPTALVNELFLKLSEQHSMSWKSRSQFFGVAAQLMRRILVDYARAHYSSKRGDKRSTVSLDSIAAFGTEPDADLLALHEALNRLEEIDPEQARIVELRFFAGLTIKETAEIMGLSHATLEREWKMAKIFLKRELTTERQRPRQETIIEEVSPSSYSVSTSYTFSLEL